MDATQSDRLAKALSTLNAELAASKAGRDLEVEEAHRILLAIERAESALRAERSRVKSLLERAEGPDPIGRTRVVAQPSKEVDHVAPDQPASRFATSIREEVLGGLHFLGVPASPRAVAEAVFVRTGRTLDARQFASVRRSDERSWRARPDRRPAYLVPALHHERFEPLRGQLTSSSWDPWRRIVGPLSPRADHLRITVRLAGHLAFARKNNEAMAIALEPLVSRYTRSVQGAVIGADIDPGRVEDAAMGELRLIEQEDEEVRRQAGERAETQLDRAGLLFGAGLRLVSEVEV